MPIHRPFRKRVVFWLDLNKPDEDELMEQIAEWKLTGRGKFSEAVRLGLNLVRAVWGNDVDAFRELVPGFAALLDSRSRNAEIEDMRAEIAYLKNQQQFTAGIPTQQQPRRVANVPDEMPDIVLHKKSSTDAAANFLESLKGLKDL